MDPAVAVFIRQVTLGEINTLGGHMDVLHRGNYLLPTLDIHVGVEGTPGHRFIPAEAQGGQGNHDAGAAGVAVAPEKWRLARGRSPS